MTNQDLSARLRDWADALRYGEELGARQALLLREAADAINIICTGCADTFVENKVLLARVEKAEALAAKYKSALEFYASKEPGYELNDGDIARKALTEEAT